MTHLVIGLGEVGTPLRQLLKADGWDVRGEHVTADRYDILHIAFPFHRDFVPLVKNYQRRWTPDLTIVHSTVPIGTTAQIPEAVHSPVNGRHGSMLESLSAVPKWFGGPRAAEAADRWPHDNVIIYDRAEQTEALKLLCLVKYGAALSAAFLADDVARDVGLTYEDLYAWDYTYNQHVPRDLRRPLIQRTSETIGGHCVVPGARLLAQTHYDPLLEAISKRG